MCQSLCEGLPKKIGEEAVIYFFLNLGSQKEGPFGRWVPNEALGGGVWGGPSGGGSRMRGSGGREVPNEAWEGVQRGSFGRGVPNEAWERGSFGRGA